MFVPTTLIIPLNLTLQVDQLIVITGSNFSVTPFSCGWFSVFCVWFHLNIGASVSSDDELNWSNPVTINQQKIRHKNALSQHPVIISNYSINKFIRFPPSQFFTSSTRVALSEFFNRRDILLRENGTFEQEIFVTF